jgi:hypothetical protein
MQDGQPPGGENRIRDELLRRFGVWGLGFSVTEWGVQVVLHLVADLYYPCPPSPLLPCPQRWLSYAPFPLLIRQHRFPELGNISHLAEEVCVEYDDVEEEEDGGKEPERRRGGSKRKETGPGRRARTGADARPSCRSMTDAGMSRYNVGQDGEDVSGEREERERAERERGKREGEGSEGARERDVGGAVGQEEGRSDEEMELKKALANHGVRINDTSRTALLQQVSLSLCPCLCPCLRVTICNDPCLRPCLHVYPCVAFERGVLIWRVWRTLTILRRV